jgi:propionate CoA-transferase
MGGRVVGPGGFINITQNARAVIFCGTLTGGGLEVDVGNNRCSIVREGRYRKFVRTVDQVTYAASRGAATGQTIMYVTERAVFRYLAGQLELVEVAPGIDPERDVLAQLEFQPRVAPDLREMDRGLFVQGQAGLPNLKAE